MPQLLPPRIAVVDDDPAVCGALRFALEAEGYAVDTYDHAETLLASAWLPDLACLIVDQRLPRLDGLGLVRALRRAAIQTPAILVTTHPDARCRRDAEALGLAIVEKPLVGDALSDRIRELVA
jgi:FixJ family two-component response regulator